MAKLELRPFVCLEDYPEIRRYAETVPGGREHNIMVRSIRIGYPVADWSRGEVKEWKLGHDEPESVLSLLLTIKALTLEELARGSNYGPHRPQDYCIELVTVEDGVCTVRFGS